MLHSRLLEVVGKHGYAGFNQMQQRAFAVLRRGVNAIIVAPTGYGKTEAAVFPVLSSILEGGVGEGIRALYITPLRALNRDIFLRLSRIASEAGVRLEVRHGDTPQSARRKIAENPPHILITTPETLQFILVHSKMRGALRTLEWVVVDELHELVSSKRGLQLSIALERLEAITGGRLRRVGLSATIRNPALVGAFLTGGRYFEVIEVREGRRYEVDVVYLGSYDDAESRAQLIADLVSRYRSVLVFTNTRDTVEVLGLRLKGLCSDAVEVHHGSLSREQRVDVERRLKEGSLKCVVATSSLELGIDVGHVDYVVQYMSPRQANRLVQRVGRGSHFLGGVARGCIIPADVDDLLESIVTARRVMDRDLEDLEFEEGAYDVLAHQLVGMVLEHGEVKLEEAYRRVSRALPYRNFSLAELSQLAEFLSRLKLLRLRDGKLSKGLRSTRYYYEAASTIPDVETVDVVDAASRRKVGTLDGSFASVALREASRFVLGGRTWEAVQVSLDEGRVYVMPSSDEEAAIPAWVGEDLPVPYKVAREVGALRRRLTAEPLDRLAEKYRVGQGLLVTAKEYVERQVRAVGVVPSDREMLVEEREGVVVTHACLGTRANALLSMVLTLALAKIHGVTAKYYFDAYRVALVLPRGVKALDVVSLLSNLGKLLPQVNDAIKDSSLYLWKLAHVCQRFGILERGKAPRLSLRKLAEALEGSFVEKEVVKELLSTQLDLSALQKLAADLSAGRVRVLTLDVKDLSPMAKSMFERPQKAGLLAKGVEPLVMLDVVRKRLERSRLHLMCLHCLKWGEEVVVGQAPSEIRCPRCSAKAVAAINAWEADLVTRVVSKWRRGEKLSREEVEVVRIAQKSAVLVMNYGKRALLCLAGRGIGPTVAARILSVNKSEEELVREVSKAEVNYIRTREFWASRRAKQGA